MKTSTVPVAVGALGLGLITKGLGKYINEIPGHIDVAIVQKIVLLGFFEEFFESLSATDFSIYRLYQFC